VIALLHDELPVASVRLVDARSLASALGVDRGWVYAHAAELKAIRLGTGRGRLRFDLDEVRRVLQTTGPPRPASRRETSRRTVLSAGGELLPIDA